MRFSRKIGKLGDKKGVFVIKLDKFSLVFYFHNIEINSAKVSIAVLTLPEDSLTEFGQQILISKY